REEPYETGELRRDLVDMVQVVGEVIEAECLTWPGDMKLVAPDGPVWCMVDLALLRRAVSNVLDNAGRAAGPTGTVCVEIQRCEALAVALKARGHQVLATATDSTAGIAEVERHRPDACLLDLRFPDPPDGLGAARVIRERCPETAVLVLSGHADPAVLAEATE